MQLPEIKEEMLRKTIFGRGAEAELYENKISVISNFKQFIQAARTEMCKPSKNKIELFSDAFFFRVRKTNDEIEYKIADFYCVTSPSYNTEEELYMGNFAYFTTA